MEKVHNIVKLHFSRLGMSVTIQSGAGRQNVTGTGRKIYKSV